MKKQHKIFIPSFVITLSLFLFLGLNSLIAQSDLGTSGTISSNNGSYKDYIIPLSMKGKYLNLTLLGADGGRVRGSVAKIWKAPGQGATVHLVTKIGDESNEIKPGSRIRFIVGERGRDLTVTSSAAHKAGGGGGGTGVAFLQKGGSSWKLLAVAGGATGAECNASAAGEFGKEGLGIRFIRPKANEGVGGLQRDGNHCADVPSAGGGAFTDGEDGTDDIEGCSVHIPGGEAGWPTGPDMGEPTGGLGRNGGGWGFGGGGGSVDYADAETPGGGGGYSGGNYNEPGTSFLNLDYAMGYSTTNGANTSSDDGSVSYSFQSNNPYAKAVKTIKMNLDQNKCLGISKTETSAQGADVRLRDCETGESSQEWYFSDNSLKLGSLQNYCLSLTSTSNPSNVDNIHLWECKDQDNQKWMYDAFTKSFRSFLDYSKCIHISKNSTQAGSAIYIYECTTGSDGQQWVMEGTAAVETVDEVKAIQSLSTQKCLDVNSGSTNNGTNIGVYKCHDHIAQQWVYDDMALKFANNPDHCLSLTSYDAHSGDNVHLWDCKGQDNQKWMYDAFTKSFRSAVNPKRCLNVTDQNNVQILDCDGSSSQQWQVNSYCLGEVDVTPPVALCKDYHTSSLTAPVPSNIDAGSYDNCSSTSTFIQWVSGNTYKLIVTDANGNSSSCTAKVY